MKKHTVKKSLEQFRDAVNKGTAEINIMLVNQSSSRKKIYKGFMLKTTAKDIQNVIIDSFKYIFEELDDRSLDPYDLEISFDESIQTVNKNEVIHGKEILDEITVNFDDSTVVVSNETDLAKIKFVVIQIHVNGKNLYLFTKYIQPSSSYKTTKKYIFVGDVLKPFNEEIITLNSFVDAILLDDTYYVYNRNSFNSIFLYKDVFEKIINDNADNIKKSGILKNSEQFIADCESDGRYLKKLTKVILAKGFEQAENNKDEIPNVIKSFKLSLKISDDGELIYNGKEDLSELLNLLLSHYVIDALTSRNMIAAAIQQYEA